VAEFFEKEQNMKKIFLAIMIAAMALTVIPQAQAQTRQQQQELEQIAMRSANGLSAQDRQRVVQIMTDVFVSQGMSRQQAATLAEQNAGSMFSTDVGEMSPEERRMFAEQEERLQYFEGTDERLRQAQEQERREAEQRRLYPGETRGWPTTQLHERGIPNLRQPAGTNASYNGNTEYVEVIYLTGANSNTLQDLRQQMVTITGKQITVSGNRFIVEYRSSGSGRFSSSSSLAVELQGNQITISFLESAA
jgi:hypothetical protein